MWALHAGAAAPAVSLAENRTPLPESETELRRSAEEFVKAIENRDSGAVLSFFSHEGTSFIGIAFSIKNPPVPFNEIRKDFEAKTGIYCLFFDTGCFRAEDSRERKRQKGPPLRTAQLISLIEMLKTAKTKRFLTYDNGKVTLLLSDTTLDRARLGRDALNFYFQLEAGQWKIVNIEYD